jgi:hypothetical protein
MLTTCANLNRVAIQVYLIDGFNGQEASWKKYNLSQPGSENNHA